MTQYEQKIQVLNHEYEELRVKLEQFAEINRRIPEYENKMAMLSQEIERLTLAIRGREEEINSGQGVIRNLQGEI